METNGTNGHATKTKRKAAAPKVMEAPAAEGAEAATGKTPPVIFIPRIETEVTEVHIRGISPLIVHAWSEKAKKEMRDKQQKNAKAARQAKDPVEDFNGSRYLDKDGRDCFPAIAFKAAAVEAGVTAGVFKTTLRKAFHVLGGDLLPLIIDGPPRMREDMVRVGQGVADMRYRAEYPEWQVKIPVEFNPRLISAAQLMHLFDNAGYSIGIGEWRPEKDGQFGRFRVVTSL